MEQSNISEKENLINDIDINNPSSIREIQDIGNSCFSEISFRENHYLCPNCHLFPRLFLINNQEKINIIISCKDSKKEEKSLEEYMKYKITEGNINKYINCIYCNNNKPYMSYCINYKINMCQDCNNRHNQRHNIKIFEKLDNEILKEEEFIKGKINNNYKNIEKINENNSIQDFVNYDISGRKNENDFKIKAEVIQLVKKDQNHFIKKVMESKTEIFKKYINLNE